jgi:hypothetical protein
VFEDLLSEKDEPENKEESKNEEEQPKQKMSLDEFNKIPVLTTRDKNLAINCPTCSSIDITLINCNIWMNSVNQKLWEVAYFQCNDCYTRFYKKREV